MSAENIAHYRRSKGAITDGDFKYAQVINVDDPTTHSPAYKLFHYYFQFYVPNNAVYDINDLEYYGLVSSGCPQIDHAVSNVRVPRTLTVADAAVLNSEGVPLDLNDPKDSVVIYMLISEHLNDWLEYARMYKGAVEIPIDGLREYDALASRLVFLARRYNLFEQLGGAINMKHRTYFGQGSQLFDRQQAIGKIQHTSNVLHDIEKLLPKQLTHR